MNCAIKESAYPRDRVDLGDRRFFNDGSLVTLLQVPKANPQGQAERL